MMRVLAALPLFILLASSEAASSHCVRSGAGGAGTGNNWTDAYTDLPASLTRGDTYYVADGSYAQHIFNDAPSGSTLITIKKATPSDHGTSAGWLDSYGDGEAVWTLTSGTCWEFDTDYYYIDGGYGTGTSRIPGSFGFRLYAGTVARSTDSALIATLATSFHAATFKSMTLKHIELDYNNGTGMSGDTGMSYCAAFDAGVTDLLIEDMFMHHSAGFGLRIRAGINATEFQTIQSSSNVTLRRVVQENMGGGGGSVHHWELFWTTGISNYLIENCQVHNVFTEAGGIQPSGVWFIGNTINTYITGCQLWQTAGATQNGQGLGMGEGVIFTLDSQNYNNTNLYVIGNTFVGWPGHLSFSYGASTGPGANLVFKNNLVYGSSDVRFETRPASAVYTIAYNAYDPTSGTTGCFMCNIGSNSQVNLTSSIFSNYAGEDFTLSGGTSGGDTTVGSVNSAFASDPSSRVRGLDGTWDRGAFEFGPLPSTVVYTRPIVRHR
jgi:hypothetical protein